MKNILKDFIIFTILVICFLFVLQNPTYLKEQTIYAMQLWITKIVPILFPTFLINDFLFQTNIFYKIEEKTKINLFYLISIISGSPANAYILKDQEADVTKIMAVNKYTSLLFLYTFLKQIFNPQLALSLIVLNILCNLILAFFIKPPKLKVQIVKRKFSEQFLLSTKKAIDTLLTIAGTVLFFNLLPIRKINHLFLRTLLFSVLEVTSSLENILLSPLSYSCRLFFTIISLSSSGLCIDFQIKSVLNSKQLKYKTFLKYRLCHMILFLSFGLLFLLL